MKRQEATDKGVVLQEVGRSWVEAGRKLRCSYAEGAGVGRQLSRRPGGGSDAALHASRLEWLAMQ